MNPHLSPTLRERVTRKLLLPSVVVYDGPSALDGTRIVAILTGGGQSLSRNEKTGPLAQLWIMRADVAPHVAVRDGRDVSVCGDCPHRPVNGGKCYVRVDQGPRSAWQAWHDGKVPTFHPLAAGTALALAVKVGRIGGLRLGAYGDPAALPLSVARDLTGPVRAARGVTTGYTHQWKTTDTAWSGLVMASADSADDQRDARAKGYRSFRVVTKDAPDTGAVKGATCPASKEAGFMKTCATCGLCNGATVAGRVGGDVRINLH
jgi:hypothetical protein